MNHAYWLKIEPNFRKFKICFETEEIHDQYTVMLDHRCPLCQGKELFKTFRLLDQHLRCRGWLV